MENTLNTVTEFPCPKRRTRLSVNDTILADAKLQLANNQEQITNFVNKVVSLFN